MWHWFDNLFDHSDPQSAKRWRQTVAKAVAGLLLFAIGIVSALTAGVPGAGKLVFDSQIDAKVAEATKQVQADVQTIKNEQQVQGDKIDNLLKIVYEQVAQATTAQMRVMKIKRCHSIDPIERDWLQKEIDRLQEQYISVKGKAYDVPACGDL